MKPHIEDRECSKAGLPGPEKAFEWPQQAMNERSWAEAAQRWAVVRQAYPERPGVWLQGAVAHIEAGELEQADVLLTYAREKFQNLPNTYTDSARLAMHQGQWDTANAFLKHARDRFPDFVQTWMRSAEYAEHQGDLEQATAYNEKARLCAPALPYPFVQHAELAMRAEQWEEALRRWKIFRTLFPKLPAGYFRAAEAARQLKRPQEARQLILAHQFGPHTLINDITTPPSIKQVPKQSTLSHLAELVWTKSLFSLRSEVHRNYLSYGWWVLEPLLHMVVYYVVFGLLLQRAGDNYPVFLLTGLIPWMWFMKSVSSSSASILSGQNLILQVGLPSIVFPLVSLVQSTLKQLPVFVLLFGFVWIQGYGPHVSWWTLIPVLIVQTLFTIAVACTVAAIIPFIRDLSYLVPTGLTFHMFLSGTFYDYRMISPEWQGLFLLNPVAFLLKCYREIFIENIPPDLLTLTWWGLGSVLACLLLMLVYRRLRYIYPRLLME